MPKARCGGGRGITLRITEALGSTCGDIIDVALRLISALWRRQGSIDNQRAAVRSALRYL